MTAHALLTEAEAAVILHMSPRTLRSLRSGGKIRYVRPSPRKVFYRADDIDEYLERQSLTDQPKCRSINPRKVSSGSSTSSSKVVGITEARAARRSGTRSDTKLNNDGGRR